MKKPEDKIKELELEVARLKGVIEGMNKMNPMPYPIPYVTQPYVRPYPYWYQTYCTSGTAQATTGYITQATGIN